MSDITINDQVEILKRTLDKLFVEFDDENDRIDFILDICSEYKKQSNEYFKENDSQT